MKKGLLALTLLVPTVGLGIEGIAGRITPIEQIDVSDFKALDLNTGNQLLGIVKDADNVLIGYRPSMDLNQKTQILNQAITLLGGIKGLRTPSKKLNDHFIKIAQNFNALKTAKTAQALLQASTALHQELSQLPIALEQAGVALQIRQNFQTLQGVFYKIVIARAKALHAEAQKLGQTARAFNLIKQADALIYSLTGSDNQLVGLRNDAIALHNQLFGSLRAQDKQALKNLGIQEGFYQLNQ